MEIANRIVRTGLEPLDSVVLNPDNWRVHPVRQQDATYDSLKSVGWVKGVIINLRTSEAWPEGKQGVAVLIDGHMRIKLAERAKQTHIPATYVDLDPGEEAFILATLDPLGALGATDQSKLLDLVAQLDQEQESLIVALRGAGIDLRSTFAHIEPEDEPEPVKPAKPVDVRNDRQPAASGPAVSRPSDRERYPLAIVLDRRAFDRWQAWKSESDIASDTGALCALLDKFIET